MSIYYKKPDNTWTELTNNMSEIRYTKVECNDKFVKKPTLQKLSATCPFANSGLPVYDNSYWVTDTIYFVDIACMYDKPAVGWNFTVGIVILDGAAFNCGSINISTDMAWPSSMVAAPTPVSATTTALQMHLENTYTAYAGYTIYLTGVCCNV